MTFITDRPRSWRGDWVLTHRGTDLGARGQGTATAPPPSSCGGVDQRFNQKGPLDNPPKPRDKRARQPGSLSSRCVSCIDPTMATKKRSDKTSEGTTNRIGCGREICSGVVRSGAHLDDPPREVAVGHRIGAGVRASSSAKLRRRRCLEDGAGEEEQSVGVGNGGSGGGLELDARYCTRTRFLLQWSTCVLCFGFYFFLIHVLWVLSQPCHVTSTIVINRSALFRVVLLLFSKKKKGIK